MHILAVFPACPLWLVLRAHAFHDCVFDFVQFSLFSLFGEELMGSSQLFTEGMMKKLVRGVTIRDCLA